MSKSTAFEITSKNVVSVIKGLKKQLGKNNYCPTIRMHKCDKCEMPAVYQYGDKFLCQDCLSVHLTNNNKGVK